MRTLRALLCCCLLAAAAQAAKKARVRPADAQTLRLVQFFLRTPTPELPPEAVEPFLAVEPASLPRKLRRPYQAKKFELYTLRQLAAGQKKGQLRSPEADCSVPKEAKSHETGVLLQAGYKEITEDEEHYLGRTTKCSEREMMCEFSLQIVSYKLPSTLEEHFRYYLYGNDPLFALLIERREFGERRNTQFFGLGGPPTCR